MHRAGARSAGAALALALAVLPAVPPAVAAPSGDALPDRAGARAAPTAPGRLPRVVNAPGAWSDEERPDGPWAALGIAVRTRPDGLTGTRERLQLFAVSAVDGRSSWVDLPGVDGEERGLTGWFALSPDGRWVGWSRERPPRRPGGATALVGWAVMDTTTGEVRRFADPDQPRLRETAADLAFSGDSRALLTSEEPAGAPARRGHRFVAWDVRDGTRTVLEEPGHYWLPVLGTAPTGVVWARGGTVHRVEPGGARTAYALPQRVVAASWGPDDTAFAFIGRPLHRARGTWRLYGGRTLDDALVHHLPLPVPPGQLLGWRDARHVVVGHFRRSVYVVDVVSGAVEEIDMAGAGEIVNAPLLAADLWSHPLAPPVERTGTRDPRAPFRWGAGAVGAILAAAVLVRWRRSRGGRPGERLPRAGTGGGTGPGGR